jgi:dTDP-4-amino-4,6-dideoxygalactose transaminase
VKIPFNKPFMSGRELKFIRQAHAASHLSGDGPFTKKCEAWLKSRTRCRRALLTHSCTGALEMAGILAGLRPGDEVILPSYAFVSTANAFVLRGAVPVFVDIRPETLNIDERKIEQAITPRTKAIVALHYGGVSCEMDTMLAIARKRRLLLIEDAAQSILCAYKGRPLGSMGDFGVFSFHETKSIISGEGGALLVQDGRFVRRAEIVREKGTNRSQFLRGRTDKYTWQDIGSSYLPSDIIAAFLWGQLGIAEGIVKRRMRLWQAYHRAFEDLEKRGKVRRPVVPAHCRYNAHLYYLLLPTRQKRDRFIREMGRRGIGVVFHYVPLHSSRAGRRFARSAGSMKRTDELSGRLVRLPLWIGLERHLDETIAQMISYLKPKP